MSLEIFNSILVLSAMVTSLGIEVIKSFLNKFNIEYDAVIISTIIAFVLGVIEIFVYYGMHGLSITMFTFIYALCMGAANSVSSTVGYDKVKEFLTALFAGSK